MDYNDAHPSTLHADTHIERAAIIRLIKAHAKDCERRGARSLGHGYLALVSEIEDAMQHDTAHVEALENPPVKVPTPVPSVFDRSWLSDGVRITTRDRGVYRGVIVDVFGGQVIHDGLVSQVRHTHTIVEFCKLYRPL